MKTGYKNEGNKGFESWGIQIGLIRDASYIVIEERFDDNEDGIQQATEYFNQNKMEIIRKHGKFGQARLMRMTAKGYVDVKVLG